MNGSGNAWAIGRVVAARVLLLVGLGVSSALLADAVLDAGTYCKFDEPCAAVAASAFGEVLGVPLAGVGVAGFAGLLLLSLVPRRWAELAFQAGAAVAGLAGAALLVIQLAVLKQVCPYCVVVDTGSVLLAAVTLARRGPAWRPAWPVVHGFVWTWAGLAAGLGPLFFAVAHQPVGPPPEVKAYWVSGTVNVVQASDFDCPACQQAHLRVRETLHRSDIHFVRVVVPMRNHEHAWPAARAYLAAVRQGKGEAMADALYTAPDRSPSHCREMAARVGLDLAAYDKAIEDGAIEDQLQANVKWVRVTDLGVPFFWVQDRLINGVPKPGELEAALNQAKAALNQPPPAGGR